MIINQEVKYKYNTIMKHCGVFIKRGTINPPRERVVVRGQGVRGGTGEMNYFKREDWLKRERVEKMRKRG